METRIACSIHAIKGSVYSMQSDCKFKGHLVYHTPFQHSTNFATLNETHQTLDEIVIVSFPSLVVRTFQGVSRILYVVNVNEPSA